MLILNKNFKFLALNSGVTIDQFNDNFVLVHFIVLIKFIGNFS